MKKLIFAVLAITFMSAPIVNAQNEVSNFTNTTKVKQDAIDKMPVFKYGEYTDFGSWVLANFNIPEEAIKSDIQGKIIVEFVVEKDGSVSSVKILQSPSEIFNAEAERVVKSSPKWEPGEHDGQKVKVRLRVPIAIFVVHN